MKKILALLLVFSILTLSGVSFAAAKDVSSVASYSAAVKRVTSLGLMDELKDGTFKPNDATTREQFAKLIVISAGLSDSAASMKGSTVFSDVSANGENNGYINLCLTKGYMAGMADGKFHPEEPITFAQAVTAMIRVLGYSEADIPGTWPKNYIEKAKSLGLTTGISLTANAGVPRWSMAQMLDILLDTKIKSDAGAASKTLAEASGLTAGTMYSVYSKPEIYYKSNVVKGKLGSIDLGGSLSIVRNSVDNTTSPAAATNGEAIKANELKDFNVVYQVSDKSGKNKYVLVIDNKVTGTITGILPNKYAPSQIEVDGTVYDLDKAFNISKLAGTGSFKLEDEVTLLLGYDNKVVDIQEALYSDNSSFAFVKNYTRMISTDQDSFGKFKYTVKLMMSNGFIETFATDADPSVMKGELVRFTKLSEDTVSLTDLNYSSKNSTTNTITPIGEINIRKEDRKILSISNLYSNDVAENVKIFNFLSNDDEIDAEAQILTWSDMPSGILKSGKVLYMNKIGVFEDVNVILVDNLAVKDYKLGVVKTYKNLSKPDDPLYNFSINVDGKVYSYSTHSNEHGITAGSIVKVVLKDGSANTFSYIDIKYADTIASLIQAVNADRIRVNNITYRFADNKNIYMVDSEGNYNAIEISQLKVNHLYGQVEIYTNVSSTSGGVVEMIVVKNK